MNAAVENAPTNDPKSVEPVTRSSKFVLASFLAFFLVIAAIVVGDFLGALFR